ncbi:MAG: FAD-dependent oxidoreductase [Trueperaceae bacterium]
MNAFLSVTAAILPIAPYLVGAALGYGALGAAIGLTWALAMARRRHRGHPPAIEAALVVGLVGAGASHLPPLAGWAPHGEAILNAALASGAAVSLARGRPWTAAYAAAAYGGAAGTPLFTSVNAATSTIWAVLFAWLAAGSLLDLPPLLRYLPLAAGGVASIALPPFLMRRGLKRMARGTNHGDWAPPDFAARPADDAPRAAPMARTSPITRTAAAPFDAVDVAIVGAGIGGLTAAALLADTGLRVAVFEQHDVPGGFAHSWTRSTRDPLTGERVTFRFDAGVHDVSGTHPGGTVRRLFERLGIDDPAMWVRLDHRYQIDGRTIDVPRDAQVYVERLAAEYPHATAGLRAVFDDLRTVYDSMFSTAAERGGIPGTPGTPEGVLAFAHAHPLAAAWMDRPWLAFVARHLQDPSVIAWLHALAGYVTDDPRRLRVRDMVPIFGFNFHGGHYPIGGSGAMTAKLVAAIEDRGGRVVLRHAVEQVLIEDGAARGVVVRPPRGERFAVHAQAVIWNGDARALAHLLDGAAPATQGLVREAQSWRTSCTALGVNLGLRGPLALPPVVHVDTPDGFAALVAPSVVDPSCAPAGYATLAILELMPHAEARSWFGSADPSDRDHRALRRDPAYIARKRAAGDRLIARARHAIPDLDERIVYRSDASPLTFARYAWTTDGAIYGVQGPDAHLPNTTPVRGLALAGAATHGGGIEAVLISGAFAAEALRPGTLAADGAPSPQDLRRVA